MPQAESLEDICEGNGIRAGSGIVRPSAPRDHCSALGRSAKLQELWHAIPYELQSLRNGDVFAIVVTVDLLQRDDDREETISDSFASIRITRLRLWLITIRERGDIEGN